jgi:hypothetical protein
MSAGFHAEFVEVGGEQRHQPGIAPYLADHHADAGAAVLGDRTSGVRITGLLKQGS